MGNHYSDVENADNESYNHWFIIKYKEKKRINENIFQINKIKIGLFASLKEAQQMIEEQKILDIDPNVIIEKKYTNRTNYGI